MAPGARPILRSPHEARNARRALGMNFRLDLDVEALDLVGDLTGVGGYDELAGQAVTMSIGGHAVKVISLEALARSKRFTGRAKDLNDLAEINEIVRRCSP